MQRLSPVRDVLLVSASALRESIQRHARYSLVQAWGTLSPHQLFECVGLAVRDLLVDRLLETRERHRQADAEHVRYLSIEYHGDVYFHLADLPAYIETQDRVGGEFRQPATWASKTILNVTRTGRFSSHRTVKEEEILIAPEHVDFISLSRTFEENLAVLRRHMHARLPLCRAGLDSVVGVVGMKDAWPLLLREKSNAAFERAARPPVGDVREAPRGGSRSC